MNFASAPFILVFLPLLLASFYAIRGPRSGEWRMALLIVASAIFYGASGWRNLGILSGSIAFNFLSGKMLIALPRDRRPLRKAVMWLAVMANLGLLLGFKIWVLDAENGQGFSAAQDVLLPLALSFITFQKIGFIASCYRGTICRLTLPRYLFFVLFFPQLVLGPIVRFEDIDRQIDDGALAKADASWVATGLAVFSVALAKKLMLANYLAVPVNAAFAEATRGTLPMGEAWFAIVTFQLQMFFDFTAYGEMAIGLAMMVGMMVPLNFDRPFFARDRADVWRRWHISFATFIRGNVFLPLVRNWHWPVWASLAMTGVLSGLWHGLGLTFVIWGLVQMSILLYLHFRNERRRLSGRKGLPAPLAIAATFLTTCLIGALFRSPEIATAGRVYASLAGAGGLGSGLIGLQHLALALLSAAILWGGPDLGQLFRDRWRYTELRQGVKPPPVHWMERGIGYAPAGRWAVASSLLLLGSLLALVAQGSASRFIYVQF